MTDSRGIRPRLDALVKDRGRLYWMIALVASALLVLAGELDRKHVAGRPAGRVVTSAVIAWLLYALVIRLVIYVVARFSLAKIVRLSPTAVAERWTTRYAVIALVAVLLAARALALALKAAGVPLATGIGILIIDSLFLSALVPLYRSGRLRAADLGLRWTRGAPGVGLVVVALLAYSVLSGVWVSLVRPPRFQSNIAGLAHRSSAVIVLTGMALCLSAPVTEEIFFRGLLYRALRNRLAVFPAAVVDGIVFGLGHTQYPLLVRPEVALFGVLACLLYERTGSLLPGMALHSLVDSTAFESALTGEAWIVPLAFLVLAGLAVAISRLNGRTPAAAPSRAA
jgi:membrane protease YdiL (CAAX protease family)